jgi:hypothetical protein
MLRPSPWSRVMATPGMRWIDSARLLSGKSAMSSALMTSMMPVASRFSLSERRSEARKPVTTMSSDVCSSAAVSTDAASLFAAASSALGTPSPSAL